MAKKKSVKKKPAKKSASKRKKAAAKTSKKKTPRKTARKKKAKKSTAKRPARKAPSLGRPKITGEEKLFLLFKDDYHARQVFDFLRVQTVKELEVYSPQEIVKRLTQPVRQTVERIRRGLAERNRCLADDEEFAVEWKVSQGR